MSSGKVVTKGVRVLLWGLFAVAALGFAFFFATAGVLSLCQGTPFFDNENLYLSLVCAVIAGLLTAMFLFGKETILLPVNQPVAFLTNARQVMEDMGYVVSGHSDNSLTTAGGFQFLFLGRGIRIQWLETDKQARISGPKLWVDMLRRRLRVQNFLTGTELSLQDTWQRAPGVLLKRVHIQMRVLPEELGEVNQNVLQVLAEHADVVCEMSVLINSDDGIRESTLEQQIRPWLSERGIVSEIRKDLVQMSESPSGAILAGKKLSGMFPRKTVKS